MLKMFSKFISSCFLFLHLLLTGSQACSYSCDPDQRACLDNVWGSVAADCSGFVGCVNITQPCAWECPPDYPVMSEDGLSCQQCQEDGGDGGEELCPQCQEGELWCRAEKACKPRTYPCSWKCPSLLHSVMTCQDLWIDLVCMITHDKIWIDLVYMITQGYLYFPMSTKLVSKVHKTKL